jgi:hypothetical protein
MEGQGGGDAHGVADLKRHLVKVIDPFVQDPLGTLEYGASAVRGAQVSETFPVQVVPKCHRASSWHDDLKIMSKGSFVKGLICHGCQIFRGTMYQNDFQKEIAQNSPK